LQLKNSNKKNFLHIISEILEVIIFFIMNDN
jgi:hypothetical protein